MSRAGTYKNKNVYPRYGKDGTGVEVGAGPLKPRTKKEKTYGICRGWCLSTQVEELWDGYCKWCLWWQNDTEAGEG